MRAATIVLAGVYGRGDIAADLVGRVTAGALRRDGRRVVVAADSGGVDTEEVVAASSLWRRLDRGTQLMLGGGDLSDDPRRFASLCVLARARGAAVSAAGVSIEEPPTWAGAQFARTVSASARVLGVRDGSSLGVARRLGARHPLLGVDLGWLAADELAESLPAPLSPGAPDVVMVSVEANTEAVARRRIALLAGALRGLRDRYPGVGVRLVAMRRSAAAPFDDHALLEHVVRFAHLRDAEVLTPHTVDEAVQAVTGVTVALGYRLHNLLLATLCGARVVAIGSGAVAETFATVPGAAVLDPNSDADTVAAATITAVGTPDWLGAARRMHVRELCDQARTHLRAVAMNGSPMRG